ncbi:hypothetical protein ABIB75_007280 [Bradyrhizobium sp. GM2.2]|nr:hypothetical protein [Bradyrhizobium sp. 84]MCK1373027.1 hypothetical protein [Bradyrhizobium sp. 49]MCK1429221.1 hypothetical protein [Bradyrhizobium sp. 87]
MNVRYRFELSQAEREEQTAMPGGDKHAARKLKPAQILLAGQRQPRRGDCPDRQSKRLHRSWDQTPLRGKQSRSGASIIVPSASILVARQNQSKLARSSANEFVHSPGRRPTGGRDISRLGVSLLCGISTPTYRLKVGNADLFRTQQNPGHPPPAPVQDFA